METLDELKQELAECLGIYPQESAALPNDSEGTEDIIEQKSEVDQRIDSIKERYEVSKVLSDEDLAFLRGYVWGTPAGSE
jgi:predicted RND superfamily exporter protein